VWIPWIGDPCTLWDSTLIVLHDMGEFMGQSTRSHLGFGREFPRTKVQIRPLSERVGVELVRSLACLGIGVDAHVGEVVPEGFLESLSHGLRKRPAGAIGHGGVLCGRFAAGAPEDSAHCGEGARTRYIVDRNTCDVSHGLGAYQLRERIGCIRERLSEGVHAHGLLVEGCARNSRP